MKKNNRNYMLLVGFGQPEESEYQKRAKFHEENFLQFTRRTRAGVPLVSEQEKIYERETEAQRERRLGLFWDSFPLIMRNWKTVLRYPPALRHIHGPLVPGLRREGRNARLARAGLTSATHAYRLPQVRRERVLSPVHGTPVSRAV